MTDAPAASTRRIALDALLRIEDGAFAHILLPRTLRDSRLEPRDRALVTDLVYGTVRMQRALDFMLAAVSNRGIGSLDPPVRAALRLGAYQLLIGVPAHAAVGETVGVVDTRARGFVNGVLRGPGAQGPAVPAARRARRRVGRVAHVASRLDRARPSSTSSVSTTRSRPSSSTTRRRR